MQSGCVEVPLCLGQRSLLLLLLLLRRFALCRLCCCIPLQRIVCAQCVRRHCGRRTRPPKSARRKEKEREGWGWDRTMKRVEFFVGACVICVCVCVCLCVLLLECGDARPQTIKAKGGAKKREREGEEASNGLLCSRFSSLEQENANQRRRLREACRCMYACICVCVLRQGEDVSEREQRRPKRQSSFRLLRPCPALRTVAASKQHPDIRTSALKRHRIRQRQARERRRRERECVRVPSSRS